MEFFNELEKVLKFIQAVANTPHRGLSIEVTCEKSIVVTIKVNKFTFFYQHYFHSEFPNDNESLLSCYSDDKKLESIAGTMEECLNHIYNLIK